MQLAPVLPRQLPAGDWVSVRRNRYGHAADPARRAVGVRRVPYRPTSSACGGQCVLHRTARLLAPPHQLGPRSSRLRGFTRRPPSCRAAIPAGPNAYGTGAAQFDGARRLPMTDKNGNISQAQPKHLERYVQEFAPASTTSATPARSRRCSKSSSGWTAAGSCTRDLIADNGLPSGARPLSASDE